MWPPLLPPFSTLALPSSRTFSWPRSSGEHELEPVLADLYLVPVAQVDRVHPDAVDVGPVEAPHVADPVAPLAVQDLRVLPRDRYVVEEDVALRAAPHGDDLVPDVVHPATRRPLTWSSSIRAAASTPPDRGASPSSPKAGA